jgi:hypothetical protein
MPATRKTLRSFVAPPAPTRETYAGFRVGQAVHVTRNADTTSAFFTGSIRRLVFRSSAGGLLSSRMRTVPTTPSISRR